MGPLALVTSVILSACTLSAPKPSALAPAASSSAPGVEAYLRLPLHFEANQGQADPRVKFLARGDRYNVFLTSTEAVVRLEGRRPGDDGSAEAGTVRLSLIGARPGEVQGEERLAGTGNYFIGPDPAAWRTDVPTYSRVRYRGIYPGVDLVYYGNQRELEFDLMVAPGADPGAIRMALQGMGRPRIDGQGDVVLRSAAGEVRLRKPLVYQDGDGGRRVIAARYVAEGDDQVRLAVARYDRRRPLVIDPVILYSSYLGGSGDDTSAGIRVDGAGNIYVAGTTKSFDFPRSSPLQSSKSNNHACFVTKLNPAGSALLFSTYLGGSDVGDTRCEDMTIDSAGNVYVVGSTSSANFPAVSAFQSTLAAGDENTHNVILAKLNSTGSALLYSTYLGGSGFDSGRGVAANDAGHVWIGGMTTSANFPVKNAVQSSAGGGADAFVARLDTTQSGAASLIYATYFGGSGDDGGSGNTPNGGIAVDGAGNAYYTGSTSSPNLTTKNAVQPGFGGGSSDAFVIKLDPAGALVYSTYLGGSGDDLSFGIAVDAGGNAYVTGSTTSGNFPTKNPFQGRVGGVDSFVTKLDATGSQLVYSTYLGGSGDDFPRRIAVDAAGNAYVVGRTGSTDFPLAGPTQPALAGGTDAYIAELNAAGTGLVFSTYLGGSFADSGEAVFVTAAGAIYVSGSTGSSDFPIVSPFQGTLASFITGGDVFITKLGAPPSALSLVASVLPSSRSVPVGGAATAFATVIAIGSGTATGCSIAPLTSLPAGFTYQTTDPATNQVTGFPNTPVNILGGAFQSFVIAFNPTGPFPPTDVQLNFVCTNTVPAPVVSGLDTLLLSASTTPVADIVALAATLGNDGIVNIPGAAGTGVFAVATVNVGTGDFITATADTGNTGLPIAITLCQTNPVTGQCLSPSGSGDPFILPTVTTFINSGETPTFGIFVQGTGQFVPFNPAVNRVFVRFTDSLGFVRGATSVAVRTQ